MGMAPIVRNLRRNAVGLCCLRSARRPGRSLRDAYRFRHGPARRGLGLDRVGGASGIFASVDAIGQSAAVEIGDKRRLGMG